MNRLLFIGFHSTPDGATPESQNELVAKLLQAHGFDVRSGSAKPRQLCRLVHQLVLMIRSLRWADAVIIDVFSGRRAWTPFLIARIARRVAIPSVLVLHGGGLPQYARVHSWRIGSTLRLGSRVVAPSAYLKKEFEARGINVTELPNLVDLSLSGGEHPPDSFSRGVLWMRAFDTEYRPALAIEAFAVLSTQHPDVWLTMAGPDRGLLADVRQLARERSVQDRVNFPGYLDAEEKARAFREHGVFLNTTAVDNTPVSVIEAMAAGLPVVATEVGGISDLLEGGRAGVLVPDGDAGSLAAAMSLLLEDVDFRARLVRSGADVAARFAPEAVVQAWQRLLNGVGVRPPGIRGAGCEPLTLQDLDDVVEVHREAFPDSAMSQLGRAVVRRYYRWQFAGPHPSPVAVGIWRDGRLVGFVFGGMRRGAVSGFVRHSIGTIALGAIRHPSAIRRLAVPKVVAVGRALARRSRALQPPQVGEPASREAVAVADPSFGVLSIAVSSAARGSSAAAELMAEAEARARELGCPRMHLTVDHSNGRAVAFYEKHGWERAPADVGWTGMMVKSLAGK